MARSWSEADSVPTDRELLRAFKGAPSIDRLRPILSIYLPLVYSVAWRRLGHEVHASEATRAVFMAFASRARRLSSGTVLATWLFHAARAAAAKAGRQARREGVGLFPPPQVGAPLEGGFASGQVAAIHELDLWIWIAPRLDKALARLRRKHLKVVLIHIAQDRSLEDTARTLRWSSNKCERLAQRGVKKLARRLGRGRTQLRAEAVREQLRVRFCSPLVPTGLAADILGSMASCVARRPENALARATLRGLTWAKWRRWLVRTSVGVAGLLLLVVGLGLAGKLLWRTGRLLPIVVAVVSRLKARSVPELMVPARPWSPKAGTDLQVATQLSRAAELFQTTNIWRAHLSFTPDQWEGIAPAHVPPVPTITGPDGTVVLRNPKAQRSGIAGSLGFDFNWVHADLEFSGARFGDVAARYRGNGTYLSSLFGPKRSIKVDLDKFDKRQALAGIHTLNFANLVEDRSYMSDALGYELFRDAGVPSPRTAYAWLTITVPGQWENKPLGVYLLLENVDGDFAAERFGSSKVPVFKPVTPELFKYLGDDWVAYADIYDLKTKAKPAQKERVIEFARLVTNADDAEFARRLGEFLDLDEFARYFAGLVLVANYDSILTYGQNYYMYLDARSGKFGFIPWDLDQAWGSFPQFGTAMTRERASIWHPWIGKNRFLERVMGVEEFRKHYREQLESYLATLFIPDRLCRRIDELALVLRDPVAAESSYRLRLFQQAVSTNWIATARDGGEGPDRPVHQLKRFIINRAASVQAQLAGISKGINLDRGED